MKSAFDSAKGFKTKLVILIYQISNNQYMDIVLVSPVELLFVGISDATYNGGPLKKML